MPPHLRQLWVDWRVPSSFPHAYFHIFILSTLSTRGSGCCVNLRNARCYRHIIAPTLCTECCMVDVSLPLMPDLGLHHTEMHRMCELCTGACVCTISKSRTCHTQLLELSISPHFHSPLVTSAFLWVTLKWLRSLWRTDPGWLIERSI